MAAKKTKTKIKTKTKTIKKKMVTQKLAPKTAKKMTMKKVAAPKTTAKPHVVKAATPTKFNNAAVAALLTPLDDRLVVAPDAASETTPGGLIIPGTVAGRPSRGRVLAKGRGKRNKKGALRPLDVSVGDRVMFTEFSGTKVTLAGTDVLILREEDVLGIVL
jgi:chaperonin GroES